MIPEKIQSKITLYAEIYTKCYALALSINQTNARWVANEMFRETAKDMRSELISRLHNGLQDECMETKEDKAIDTSKADATDSKEENGKPATENQRYALHKFGIENIPERLTKKVAYEILNSLVCLSKEGDRDGIKEIVERLNAMDDWRIEKVK